MFRLPKSEALALDPHAHLLLEHTQVIHIHNDLLFCFLTGHSYSLTSFVYRLHTMLCRLVRNKLHSAASKGCTKVRNQRAWFYPHAGWPGKTNLHGFLHMQGGLAKPTSMVFSSCRTPRQNQPPWFAISIGKPGKMNLHGFLLMQGALANPNSMVSST